MRVKKILAFLIVFATQQMYTHATIDAECQYPNSIGYYSTSSRIAKSEDECRKSCESNPLCMVWVYLVDKNACQLGKVSLKSKENSLFIMNNCKGGQPSVSAPPCEVKKGKLTGSIRAHQVTSLEECEKLCDVDCMAYRFFLDDLDKNKSKCGIWTFKVVEDPINAQVGFHYCNNDCRYPNTVGHWAYTNRRVKSEDQCRETCASNQLCMVWEYLMDKNVCVLQLANLYPKNDSLFVMKNCKGGYPSESAPPCAVKKGKGKGTGRGYQVKSQEECEKLCNLDCLAWRFFLHNNKTYCSIWTLKVVEDPSNAQVDIHYCNDKCKFPKSSLYMNYPFINVKTEDECRETCKNNPMCIVWQMKGNKCQIYVVTARPSTDTSFVINNCKRGKPTESAPNCKVNEGVGFFAGKLYRNQTAAGCEKICGNDCLMWQFSTTYRYCYIYSIHYVRETGDALFGINYCKEIPSTIQSTTGTCRCGVANRIPTPLVNNVVGGTITSSHQYPWQVFIKGYNLVEKQYEQCGGTIISSKSILTAAHCMINHIKIKVWVGIQDIRTATSETGLKVCDKYNLQFNNLTGENDMAILILCNELVFDQKKVAPICLPSSDTGKIDNKFGIAIGWGSTYQGGPPSDELREVGLYADDTPSCEQSFPGGEKIYPDQICAYAYHKGACIGDSGGPLMMPIGFNDWNKPYFQAGIVSGSKFNGCSSPKVTDPTIFIRTIPNLSFIKKYMLGKVCT